MLAYMKEMRVGSRDEREFKKQQRPVPKVTLTH